MCPYKLFPQEKMPIKKLMEIELPYSETFSYTSKGGDLTIKVSHEDLMKPENVTLSSEDYLLKQCGDRDRQEERKKELMELTDIVVCIRNVVDSQSRDSAIQMWLLSMQMSWSSQQLREQAPNFDIASFLAELQYVLKTTKNAKVAKTVLQTIQEILNLQEGQSYATNLKILGYDPAWNTEGSGIFTEEAI